MENLKTFIDIILDKEYQNTSRKMAYFLKDGGNIHDYETYNTLINLYASIQNDSKQREIFLNYLIDSIQNNEIAQYSECIGTAHLAVYTLTRLGFHKQVIQALHKRQTSTFLIPVVLNSLIIDSNRYFDDSDLSDIREFLRKQINALDQVDNSFFADQVLTYADDIVDLRYGNLKKSIKNINLEINFDKETVTEKIDYLGLDSKFAELLDEIDIYINTDTTKFVNAAMIGHLRVFMQDIFKDVANRISIKLNEDIPKIEGKGEMGNVRNFIKEKLELHENEDKFINNFISILHAEGGHSFTSETEYFRLARNIAIEIALLLLSKYEKKFFGNK